jgi:hypothetical protein
MLWKTREGRQYARGASFFKAKWFLAAMLLVIAGRAK